MKADEKRNTGFTLTELLVVIAGIALLAATLLPALAGTKLRDLGAQCLNNLRQLTVAATIYQTENKNIYWGSTSVDWHNIWLTSLSTPQNSAAIHLQCPLAANPVSPAYLNDILQAHQGAANRAWTWPVFKDPNNIAAGLMVTNGSYGLNGWLYAYNATVMLWINSNDGARFFGSTAAITHPGQTPEFVDSLWPDLWPYQGGQPDFFGTWFPYDANNNSQATGVYQGMMRCLIQRHGPTPPLSVHVVVSDTVRPLPGGINVSFVDGHVAYTSLDNLWLLYWNRNIVPHSRP